MSTLPKAASASSRHDVWGPTSLQREYRRVLDSAKEHPQVIVDSDGSALVVQLKDDADFARQLVERFAQAGRFYATYRANRGRPSREWARQTDFPYIGALNSDDVDEFARELLSYAVDAAQRGVLDHLEGNLRAWESTASIYADPSALAEMTAELDPAELVEVHPPSEKEAEADGT